MVKGNVSAPQAAVMWPRVSTQGIGHVLIPSRDSSSSLGDRYNEQQRAHLILLITETWQREEHGQKRLKDLRHQRVPPHCYFTAKETEPQREEILCLMTPG